MVSWSCPVAMAWRSGLATAVAHRAAAPDAIKAADCNVRRQSRAKRFIMASSNVEAPPSAGLPTCRLDG